MAAAARPSGNASEVRKFLPPPVTVLIGDEIFLAEGEAFAAGSGVTGAGLEALGPAAIPVIISFNDFLHSLYVEHLKTWGIGPIFLAVPVDSVMYMGEVVSEGILFKTGKASGTCVATQPNTRGVKKLKTQAVIAADTARLMLKAYDLGVSHGSHQKRDRCEMITIAMRRFDTLLKQSLMPQDPSFPRKKSQTGVTRIGRRKKGPG